MWVDGLAWAGLRFGLCWGWAGMGVALRMKWEVGLGGFYVVRGLERVGVTPTVRMKSWSQPHLNLPKPLPA